MNKKVLMLAGVAMTALLGGCANTALEESVNNLGNKVDQLATEVSSLKSEQNALAADVRDVNATSLAALAEAQLANDRIDNIASSYKK